MPLNQLDRQRFYRGFKRRLRNCVGKSDADRIWEEAGREYDDILAGHPERRAHKGAMVLPAVALFRVLSAHGLDAEQLLNEYGDKMGECFARIVHGITGIPGISRMIWNHVDGIMNKMSGEALGYKKRIVSEPPEMYGVDILSCPYHELARDLGTEKAVLCICHMDKAYMKGFRHIRYERTTAVSEGAECCDYRLRYDREKK